MAREGKKGGIGKVILIVVVVLVVVGAMGSLGGGDSDSSSPNDSGQPSGEQVVQADEQSSDQQEEEVEPYTISDEELDTSNPYALYITGTLTNNTESELSYVQVEYNLYDAEGAQIGTALANTNNLQPGGVWKYEAYATADSEDVASYELMDVTGF